MVKDNVKLESLSNAVIEGNLDEVLVTVKELIETGMDPLDILERGLNQGIRRVGEKYGRGDIFITELIMSAEAMKCGMKILNPEILRQKKELKMVGSMVIGTVAGDIHDLGKNIVSALFSAQGFRVYDLGVDVPNQTFIDKVEELKPDILGLSALMTTTIPKLHEIIKELKKAGLKDKVKVMVGGAVVDKDLASEIESDGYAENAVDAVEAAKELIGVN